MSLAIFVERSTCEIIFRIRSNVHELTDNVHDIVDKFYVQDIVDYPLMSVETSVTGKKPKDNLFLDKNQVGRYE
jgi:hypothetical protein